MKCISGKEVGRLVSLVGAVFAHFLTIYSIIRWQQCLPAGDTHTHINFAERDASLNASLPQFLISNQARPLLNDAEVTHARALYFLETGSKL